jgi:hypothetical protein
MIDLLLDVFWGIVVSLIGGAVGLVWPPRTRAWARAQKAGIILLCASVTAWTASNFSSQPRAFWILIIIGVVFFIGFLIVGNICRVYHEKHYEDDSISSAKSKQ